MAFQYINTGTSSNSGDGDTLRVAFQKVNANFAQVETRSTSTIRLSDSNDAPVVDIVYYSGSFDLPEDDSPVKLIELDQRIHRSAVIDIFAEDQTDNTQDVGSSYTVTWNSSTSIVLGTGIVSLERSGETRNAHWDLVDTVIENNRVGVRAYNVSGSTASNTIAWRAKVSLFRL